MALREAAAVLGAACAREEVFTSVSTDTRALAPGALFVALRGPHHDAHAYLGAARAAGAVGALVERPVDDPLAQIQVADTRAALGALAAAWRARFAAPAVAVTGSNGKTTVKEMLAAILARRGPVLATRGNRNNAIGVPLTLLEWRAEHRAAVLELGMNAPGEIAALAALVRPAVGVITNAGPAHLEGLGTTAAVARAKGELLDVLAADGSAVLNADDPHFPEWRARALPRRVLAFGRAPRADVRADARPVAAGTALTVHTPAGSVNTTLALPGAHNVANALAAAGAALALGVPLADIAAGLAAVRPVPGRLCLRAGWDGGVEVLDDTYNANPASLAAAIAVLAERPGTRVLVLGDMGELGAQAAALHAQAGAGARAAGLDALYALGPLAAAAARDFGSGGASFESAAAVVAALRARSERPLAVLVKGSRAARMERVVAGLLAPEAG